MFLVIIVISIGLLRYVTATDAFRQREAFGLLMVVTERHRMYIRGTRVLVQFSLTFLAAEVRAETLACVGKDRHLAFLQ